MQYHLQCTSFQPFEIGWGHSEPSHSGTLCVLCTENHFSPFNWLIIAAIHFSDLLDLAETSMVEMLVAEMS